VFPQNFMVAPTVRGDVVGDVCAPSSSASVPAVAEYQLQASEIPEYVSSAENAELGDMLLTTDVVTLSQAIEKERLVTTC